MDRREFFGMGGGVAAATALRSTGINVGGTSDPALGEVKRLLAAALGGQNGKADDGPLTVSISGEFMEDYTAGTPWMGSVMKIEVPYVSRNGTAQIYSFQGHWNQVDPEIVERVYADPDPEKFPDQDTLTGWTYESKPLPIQDPNWAQNYNPPNAFIISYTDYHYLDPVLLPEGKSKPDRLMVYRDAAVYSAPLGDDGSIGEFKGFFLHPNPPLVQGPLPAGTKYIFENWIMENCYMRNSGRWPDCKNGLGLRDVDTLAYYPLDWQNLFTGEGLGFVKIIPLSGDPAGEYSCVALETGGKVTYLRLKLDGNVSRVVSGPPIVLGHSDNGLVTAFQDSSGLAQVFFFDLPAIRTIQVYHNPQSGIVHQELATVELEDFQMPNYPANMRYDIMCQFNPLLRQPEVFITVKDPYGKPSGGLTEPLMELWTTTRLKKGWDKLTPADKGVRNVVMAAAQSPTLFIQRPRTGFEYWVRDEGGDWDSVHVRTETGDGELLESAGYRVGITLKRDGVAVSTGEFGLSATVASTAVIRGRHGTLGMHRPWQAKSDATGTLWVTVLLEDRTTFPQLAITSDQFADRLVLDLNHRIDGFMSTVTSDQLLKARDPRHCTEQETDGCSAAEIASELDAANAKAGITDPEKAEQAAKSIRETLTSFSPSTALSKTTSKPIQVDSRIPWGWLPLSQDLSVLHPVVAKNGGPSFRIFRKDGVPHLELVSHEVARARAAELRSMHPAYEGDGFASLGTGHFGMFDFITDTFDAIGDAAQAVWDGACQLGEAIVDGVNFTLHLVIDGLNWVFNAVMDTIDMIMDAIDFVLEYAGMALGMAVGWLLEQLGFLFDWKAIKERRDFLHDYIRKNLRPALNTMGKPVNGAIKFKSELATMRREAFAALNTLMHTPAAEDAWKNAPGEGESVSSSFSFINDFSVFPQATWLMDKVMSALPRGKGGLDQFDGLPILDAAFATFGQALTKASDNFFGVLTDLVNFFQKEFAEGKIITAQALDPLIELLQNLLARLFKMFEIIIDALAQLLQIFWDNAEMMLNLFDGSIPVPAFFRGFYKGLTGNNPTPLDMACLLAAIPMSAEAYESPKNTAESRRPGAYAAGGPHFENAAYLRPRRGAEAAAGEGGGFPDPPRQTPAEIVSASFQGAGALVGAFSMGVTAFTTEGAWSDGLGMMGYACTIGSMVANLVDEKRWLTVGIGSGVGVVLALIAYKMNGRSASIRPVSAAAAPPGSGGLIAALKERSVQALGITAAVEGLLSIIDISVEGDPNSYFAHLATGAQMTLGIWVKSEKAFFKGNPAMSGLVGVLNGSLGGIVTGLYIYRPMPLLLPPSS